MTTVNDIFENLNELAPVSLKMDFDNVGLLVGSGNNTVKKCLISLDITNDVIEEAVNIGADLIVSHHPLVFDAQKTVLENDLVGGKIYKLIKNGISAICMHTNLDIAVCGVNDALMAALQCPVSGELDEDGCGRIGEYDAALSFDSFLIFCKERLNTKGLRYYYASKPVKKLAVMGGSGGGSLARVKELGCDTYVTADVKYNQFLDAKEMGINLIDADHFCTENVVIPVLEKRLTEAFPDTDFFVSSRHCQTVSFY